jgi:capsular polysaccharide biosynthesis protein
MTRKRSLPKNFVNNDYPRFQNSLLSIDPITKVEIKEYIVLHGDLLYQPLLFKFLGKYTHTFKLGRKQRLKFILSFFNIPQKINNAIWIIDNFSFEYYHWLIECLSKLVSIKNSSEDSVLLLPSKFQSLPYVLQSLQLLRITPVFYNEKKTYLIKKIILPSYSAREMNFNIHSLFDLRKNFSFFQKKEAKRSRIYITRSNANYRRVVNESDLINILHDRNIQIIDFAKHSFLEQVEMMSNCEFLVGPHGAGLSNVMFINSSVKVLELRNENDNYWNMFFSLSVDLGHDYYYYLCKPLNYLDSHNSDLFVNPRDFSLLLDNILACNNT